MNYPEDQEILIDEALANVKQRAFKMERSLNSRKLLDAINHASDMVLELKNPNLSPKSYYELYISVTDKLRIFESYLVEEHKMSRKVLYIYETVQYIGSIVPRLYLLITVGIYLIKCSELSRREILRDLVEICSGIQHPTRGLFLRNYLLHSLRAELLPSITDSSSNENNKCDVALQNDNIDSQGTIMDSINFLLLNFAEMNKLWVRMQHQGHSREREKREQERRELRLLVGTNLNRLSQLEAIDVELYKTHVLPPIVEQIIECRDVIAQEYLMDVVIQVFPDEFHMATLPMFLRTCHHLQPGVKPKPIIFSLIGRLSKYALAEMEAGRDFVIPIVCHVKCGTKQCTHLQTPTKEELNGDDDDQNDQDDDDDDDDDGSGGDVLNLDKENSSKVVNKSVHTDCQLNTDLFSLFFYEVNQIVHARLALCELSSGSNTNSGVMQARHSLSTAALLNGLPLEDIPSLFSSLVYLAMLLHPDDCTPLIDACLNATADALKRLGLSSVLTGSSLSRELLSILYLPLGDSSIKPSNSLRFMAPVQSVCDLRTLIAMSGFRSLVSLLDPQTTRYRFACGLLTIILDREQHQSATNTNSSPIVKHRSSHFVCEQDVDNLFELFGVLLNLNPTSYSDLDEFIEAQNLLAGVLHMLGPCPQSSDPQICLTLLIKAKSKLEKADDAVIRFTFPTLIFQGLQLAQIFYDLRDEHELWISRAMQFCHQCSTGLVAANGPESGLRMFLHSALVMDKIKFKNQESMTYEFVSQAITLYEEGVSDSRAQVESIALITSALCEMRCFTEENQITLRTQCTRAAMHLLRKHDQCRAIAMTAHLYWPTKSLARNGKIKPSVLIPVTDNSLFEPLVTSIIETDDICDRELEKLRDPKGVISCLNRAFRFAKECMDIAVRTQLYIDILDLSISLRMLDCHQITDERINHLIGEIHDCFKQFKSTQITDHIGPHFENILNLIKHCQLVNRPVDDDDENMANLFANVQLDSNRDPNSSQQQHGNEVVE